jgi:hypothetical protein
MQATRVGVPTQLTGQAHRPLSLNISKPTTPSTLLCQYAFYCPIISLLTSTPAPNTPSGIFGDNSPELLFLLALFAGTLNGGDALNVP